MDEPRGLNTKFGKYQVQLINLLSENEINEFSPQKNRLELVKLAEKLENKYTVNSDENGSALKLIKFVPVKGNSKDLKLALELKDKGNQAFGKGHWTKALQLYNQSYLLTPQDDEVQLCTILANRTATLYHCQKYQKCIEEIDDILKVSADISKLRYKLMERKARCHLALKEHKLALEAFRSTLQLLDITQLPLEKRQKLQTEVQVMIKLLTKNLEQTKNQKQVDQKSLDKNSPFKEKEAIKNKSKTHPSASDAVLIVEDEKGRHAVASRDIKTGELILKEQAHAHILLHELSRSRCQHCLQTTLTPIACATCASIIFCSKACKEAAKGYHTVECPSMNSIDEAGFSLTCLLSLRMLSQKSVQYFVDLKVVLDKMDEGQDKHGETRDPSSYLSVYGLLTHTQMRTCKDLAYRAFTSLYLARCLDLGGYFKGCQHKQEDFLYCASLILHNMQLCQFNAHEVSELGASTDGKNIVRTSKLPGELSNRMLGGAIYPTLALFNHSCNPGLVRCQKGTEIYVKTVRPIMQGEEIPENYGPVYTQMPKVERIMQMKQQYWFECSCEACKDNWLTLEEMPTDVLRLRCTATKNCGNVVPITKDCEEIMVQCTKCKQDTNIIKGITSLKNTDALFKEAGMFLGNGKYHEALKKYINILELLHSSLVPPFKDYNLCQQGIRTCMLYFGNKSDELCQLNNQF